MATEKLEIQVSADVQSAVTGLNKLNKSISQTSKELPALNKATGQSTQTLINLGRVAQDAPFGFIGIANNIDPLVQSFGALRKETGSVGGAFKALAGGLVGGGGIGLALSLITSAATFAAVGFDRWKQKTQEAKDEADKAADSIVGQYTNVLLLTTALKNSQTTLAERKDIISQLNGVSDKYFGGLNAEKLTIEQLDKAYDGYINNLLRSFAVKQLEQDLEPLIKRLATAQVTIKKLGTSVADLGLDKIDLRSIPERERQALASSGVFEFNAAKREEANVRKEINSLIESAVSLTSEENRNRNKGIKEGVDLLKEYREEIKLLNLREQAGNTEIFRQKLDLAFKTFDDLVKKGISPARQEFAFLTEEINKYLALLPQIKAFNEEQQKIFNPDPTIKLTPKPQQGIDINRADRTSALVLTPEALQQQLQYQSQLDAINEKLLQQRELVSTISQTIESGLNAGVDQFFNALANNQDPFEALSQSVKRLVVDLAAAVVKMLVIKTISNALLPGSGELVSAGVNGLQGVLRGNDIGLTLFRGLGR